MIRIKNIRNRSVMRCVIYATDLAKLSVFIIFVLGFFVFIYFYFVVEIVVIYYFVIICLFFLFCCYISHSPNEFQVWCYSRARCTSPKPARRIPSSSPSRTHSGGQLLP